MGISIFPPSTGGLQEKNVVYGVPGSYTFNPPTGTSANNPLLCEVTVVGAGGGGGNYNTGSGISGTGGGAGTVIQQQSFYVTGPTSVTVGAGGAAQAAGGNSSIGSLVALGGAAGSAVTTPTNKNTGTDDCTRGAAGLSAIRLLMIGRESTGDIYWKDPNALTTAGDGFGNVSKPPFTTPNGQWSVATNGSHIIAANTFVNGIPGGNSTAFYNAATGWTIRSIQNTSGSAWSVATINGVAVCMPGSSANTQTYYYAQNGSNTWTTATLPFSDWATGNSWLYNFAGNNREELFVMRRESSIMLRTVNGINWTTHTLPATVSSGHFSGSNAIARRPNDTTYVYYRFANINNGGTGNCWTSTDLTNWTAHTVISPNNPNTGSGEGFLAATSGQFWWRGASSDSGQANIFFSGNGINWSGFTWDQNWMTGTTFPTGHLVFNNTWYAGVGVSSGTGWQTIRYGGFYPSTYWTSGGLIPNGTGISGLGIYPLAGVSNIAPTAFTGISDLQPTGGSSGVPSTGGDGGNGGSYIAPIAKSTTASAAATPGQVPGAGGGGGGAGSTTGAAGANGLVSIKFYG